MVKKKPKKKKNIKKFVPRTNLCIHNIKGVIYCVASKLLAYVYELYTVPKTKDKKRTNKIKMNNAREPSRLKS